MESNSNSSSDSDENQIDSIMELAIGNSSNYDAVDFNIQSAASEFTNFDMISRYGSNGFELGLTPSRILGATQISGETMLLISWMECDETDLVPASIANNECPQLVIKFYEERIVWKSLRLYDEVDRRNSID